MRLFQDYFTKLLFLGNVAKGITDIVDYFLPEEVKKQLIFKSFDIVSRQFFDPRYLITPHQSNSLQFAIGTVNLVLPGIYFYMKSEKGSRLLKILQRDLHRNPDFLYNSSYFRYNVSSKLIC